LGCAFTAVVATPSGIAMVTASVASPSTAGGGVGTSGCCWFPRSECRRAGRRPCARGPSTATVKTRPADTVRHRHGPDGMSTDHARACERTLLRMVGHPFQSSGGSRAHARCGQAFSVGGRTARCGRGPREPTRRRVRDAGARTRVESTSTAGEAAAAASRRDARNRSHAVRNPVRHVVQVAAAMAAATTWAATIC
jgi:hypothetical protein